MTDKEKAIKEREEKIKQLRAEIHELKNPTSIKKLTVNKMFDVGWYDGKINYDSKNNMGWEYLRKMCLELFRVRHKGENMTIETLTHAEAKLAASMADEIILIWNRYIQIVYGKGDDNANG